jgi:hypothetical protein
MKFTSTTVVTEIFSGDFCDYELQPNPYVAGYKNNVYKHCCRK